MIFKTPMAYAVFVAASATLPLLALGITEYVSWWILFTLHMTVKYPALTYGSIALGLCAVVFVVMVCAGLYYGRRLLSMSDTQTPNEVPRWVLLPKAAGVYAVCWLLDKYQQK